MMIFPSTTVVLLVNRSSSIPPLKILAGVVIETKNRPDENEEAFSSLRDDCPHSCCYFIAKCFVAVFCGKCITPKALDDDDDVEQSLERGRLDVVRDVVTLFKDGGG